MKVKYKILDFRFCVQILCTDFVYRFCVQILCTDFVYRFCVGFLCWIFVLVFVLDQLLEKDLENALVPPTPILLTRTTCMLCLQSTNRKRKKERETLGVVWGLERFNYYIFGKHCTVNTDTIQCNNFINSPKGLF